MWHLLPYDIIELIISIRMATINKMSIKIQSIWRCYRTRVLIGRYRLLKYLRDFNRYNPNIQAFVLRSRL